jgi:hypothetical protein
MSLKMNLNIFFTIGFFEKRREESFKKKVVFLLALKMITLGPTTQGPTCLY